MGAEPVPSRKDKVRYMGFKMMLTNEQMVNKTMLTVGKSFFIHILQKSSSSWMETDIDNNKSDNRAEEFEHQLMMETRASKSSKVDVYLNAYESSALNHEYRNINQHDLSQREGEQTALEHSGQHSNQHEIDMNPYEDDVQTVHSEGIRSEMDTGIPPPLHKRPHHNTQTSHNEDDKLTKDIEDEICTLTLGDISEADDRVKKFYGIIPKDNSKEIKTVRMVKRDSKERSTSALGNGYVAPGSNGSNKFYDDISEMDDVQNNLANEISDNSNEPFQNGPPPPPPLPRGNYGQNLHNFLSNQSQPKDQLENGLDDNLENIIDLTSTSQSSAARNEEAANERKFRGQTVNGEKLSQASQRSASVTNGTPKANFVLGEYQRRKSKVTMHLLVDSK